MKLKVTIARRDTNKKKLELLDKKMIKDPDHF